MAKSKITINGKIFQEGEEVYIKATLLKASNTKGDGFNLVGTLSQGGAVMKQIDANDIAVKINYYNISGKEIYKIKK